MIDFIKSQSQATLFIGLATFFAGLITTLYLTGAITTL